MGGWAEFTFVFIAFMLSHAIPAMPRLKQAIVARLGRRGYLIGYSLVSLALFYWLILAAGRAPFVEFWPQTSWQRWLVNVAMPAAIALIVFGAGAPNPFAFGGAQGFDPARPGIAGVTRHPLMWGFALWAGAHLLANGDLAHLIFFGTLLLLALAGVWMGERRARRLLGADWARLTARTSILPGWALVSGRWRPAQAPPWRRLVIAVVIWAVLFHLHEPVIGYPPAP